MKEMKEWQGEPSQGCLAVQMQLFLVNEGFALLIFPPYFYVCRYVVCLFVFILHVTKDAERGCQCHHIGLISPALGIAIFSSPPPGKTPCSYKGMERWCSGSEHWPLSSSALPGNLSSVPRDHFRQLTTTCNSTSKGSHAVFWCEGHLHIFGRCGFMHTFTDTHHS